MYNMYSNAYSWPTQFSEDSGYAHRFTYTESCWSVQPGVCGKLNIPDREMEINPITYSHCQWSKSMGKKTGTVLTTIHLKVFLILV